MAVSTEGLHGKETFSQGAFWCEGQVHPCPPKQTISVLVMIREIMPSSSPGLNAQKNKAMCLSCTLQFLSAMPLLSEWEAKCLLRTLWGKTSRESVRLNFEFSSIWDGARKDPRPQRAFLGLSPLLFGIWGYSWSSGGSGGHIWRVA